MTLHAVIALYLFGLGFLAGIATERIRFSAARATVLARLESVTRELHNRLMALEGQSEVDAGVR